MVHIVTSIKTRVFEGKTTPLKPCRSCQNIREGAQKKPERLCFNISQKSKTMNNEIRHGMQQTNFTDFKSLILPLLIYAFNFTKQMFFTEKFDLKVK